MNADRGNRQYKKEKGHLRFDGEQMYAVPFSGFKVAHAYFLTKEDYDSWIKYLAQQKNSPPKYHLLTNNCTCWVVNAAKLTGVDSYTADIADPDAILDGGKSINTYNPADLAVFLRIGRPKTYPPFLAPGVK